MAMKTILGMALLLTGCDFLDMDKEHERNRVRWAREASEEWEKPCLDVSWLLATTSGSPSEAKCTNRRHKMRVQVASAASKEEFGAVVFCECLHDDARDGGR